MPTEEKPGPGWSKNKDGRWAPHWLTFADFPGAQVVATLFKTLALAVLVIGAVSAAEAGRSLHQNGVTGPEQAAVVAGIVVGTIVAAATMAFFGYVLQLLTTIHFDTRYGAAVDRAYPRPTGGGGSH